MPVPVVVLAKRLSAVGLLLKGEHILVSRGLGALRCSHSFHFRLSSIF